MTDPPAQLQVVQQELKYSQSPGNRRITAFDVKLMPFLEEEGGNDRMPPLCALINLFVAVLVLDGGLIVGASNLTGRCWTGCLAYYAPSGAPGGADGASGEAHGAPRLVTQLDSGVTDVKWIKGSNRFVTACDSGDYFFPFHCKPVAAEIYGNRLFRLQ